MICWRARAATWLGKRSSSRLKGSLSSITPRPVSADAWRSETLPAPTSLSRGGPCNGQGKGWAKLITRPDEDSHATVQAFKTEERRKIAEVGYTIIATVGDQQSDLDGGFAEW
jgi:HAD superfamily, subfamily IIIB (Acid phosphatase)